MSSAQPDPRHSWFISSWLVVLLEAFRVMSVPDCPSRKALTAIGKDYPQIADEVAHPSTFDGATNAAKLGNPVSKRAGELGIHLQRRKLFGKVVLGGCN